MNLKYLLIGFGIAAAGLSLSGNAAQAFSFSTNFTGNDPKGDIWLNSVSFGGKTVTDFALVNAASIVSNPAYTGGNTGAASADKGDLTTTGVKKEGPTAADIVTNLGNKNLNNIIDGEDSGAFKINLKFDRAVSNLFFWERGMNSDLNVQALDAGGNLVGNLFKISRNLWTGAGYSIDTTEIGGAQRVGSYGLSLADLGVGGPIAGIQVSALSSFNGPDFKVAGEAAAVPEPATMAGLALAGSGLAWARRRRLKQA